MSGANWFRQLGSELKRFDLQVLFSSSHWIIMSVRRSSSKSVSSLVSFGSSRRISTSSGVVTKGFESSGFGYGNLGGYDIFSKSVTSGYETPLFGNEKQTMMNLNDRLASYLEKVTYFCLIIKCYFIFLVLYIYLIMHNKCSSKQIC